MMLFHTQETLDNLRIAMGNTKVMCAAMLDTKVRVFWTHSYRYIFQ